MEPFCNNAMCPHFKLEMNDEKHYHSGDEGVVSSICGVLKTHPVKIKLLERNEKKHKGLFSFFDDTEFKYKIKEYHFCDACYTVVILLKGLEYE